MVFPLPGGFPLPEMVLFLPVWVFFLSRSVFPSLNGVSPSRGFPFPGFPLPEMVLFLPV